MKSLHSSKRKEKWQTFHLMHLFNAHNELNAISLEPHSENEFLLLPAHKAAAWLHFSVAEEGFLLVSYCDQIRRSALMQL